MVAPSPSRTNERAGGAEASAFITTRQGPEARDGNRAGLQPRKAAPIISEGKHAAEERMWRKAKLSPPFLLRSKQALPNKVNKKG